jgi:DNA mismatch endonuclease, patch repair protein
MLLRRQLHKRGFRYRVHAADLPGTPDLILPKYTTAIFVHGCFWHRHKGCNIATTPKSNTSFWVDKFERNVSRDIRVRAALRKDGWNVLVVWECQVASNRKAADVADRVALKIKAQKPKRRGFLPRS